MERKWFFSHGIMQTSIIPTLSHPCLSIAQELMLGGVVAKWDAQFSTESLWDTQVGHQSVGENQKNKGMRPLLPLHPPIAGLSNQGTDRSLSVKTLFSNEVTFTGLKINTGTHLLDDHHSIHYIYQLISDEHYPVLSTVLKLHNRAYRVMVLFTSSWLIPAQSLKLSE